MEGSDQSFPAAAGPRRPGLRLRHGDGLEFDRVSFFSDAVFAIAMTLLVIAIEAPRFDTDGTPSVDVLWHAIREEFPSLFSFFLAFYLLGRFWMSHHGFTAALGAVNRTLIGLNLIYLAFIALVPYPTSLLGNYASNPLSVAFFALVLSVVSGMESVMYAYAHRAGLMRRKIQSRVFRAGMWQSTTPIVVFLASIPVAFASPLAAMLMWLLAPVLGMVLDRVTGVRGEDVRDQIEG